MQMRGIRWLGMTLAVAVMGACASGDADVAGAAGTVAAPEPQAIRGASNRNGLFRVDVQVEEGTSAFFLTAFSDAYLSIEEVKDPGSKVVLSWEDWLNSDDSLTEAISPDYRDLAFNWPVRQADGPLKPGTYTVTLATTDRGGSYIGPEDVRGTLLAKRDGDFSSGRVAVTLAYAGDLLDDAGLREAIDTSMIRWRRVWGDRGIEVDVTERSADLPASVPEPDSREVFDLAAEGTDEDLLVIIADGIRNDPGTYGISGGIPGSPLATPRSATVVSWVEHAGRDGDLSEEEALIMGETIAHEVGHYMGLFHPVEDDYRSWDALDDTPRCNREGACEDALGSNLMFPYPLCSRDGCVPQVDLSAGQAGVMHRYVGTL